MSITRRSAPRRNGKTTTDDRFWKLQRLVKDYFALLSTGCRQCKRRVRAEEASNLKALRESLEEGACMPAQELSEQVRKNWENLAHEAGFALGKMAVLSGVSPRHLQRIFKRQFRCCPCKWLRELRCHEAKRLIAQGYSSKGAAAELKFATEAHFCREFKKVFGVSPQHFAPSHVPFGSPNGAPNDARSASHPGNVP